MQTQEVSIKPNLKVILKNNAELLDEVIVTAYGTAKKSAFTGSASVVSSEDIGKIQSSNVANALSGKVSGVQLNNNSGQPGSTKPTIRIRGISSINAGNDPLIILDGVPYDGDMNNISSQDIESMTVLKDAASNALYGARGANGVIIITTKKGNSGQARVTVDAKWGSNSRGTQDYKTVSNPAQYYEMYYGALKNYLINSKGYTPNDAHIFAATNMAAHDANNDYSLGYNAYNVPQGQYLIGSNGKLNPNAVLGNIVEYGGQQYLIRPDKWLDEVYSHGLRQEYNVNVSAGTDKSSFYTSVSYLNNEGITVNSNYERLTGRLKADYQVKDWLKVGTSISGSFANSSIVKTATNNQNNGTEGIIRSALTYPATQTQDDLDNEYSMVAVPTRYADALNENRNISFRTSNYLNITLTKGLIFRTVLGYNYTHNDANKYWPRTMAEGKYVNGKSYGGDNWRSSLVFDNLLMFNQTWGKHNVSATAGTSWEASSNYNKVVTVQGFGTDATNGWLLQDASEMLSATSGKGDSRLFSLIGRLAYNYAGKYYLTFTARDDVSSKLAIGKRAAFFPSVGFSYRLSEEKFMKGVSHIFDNIKLRYSYGASGNQAISSYQTFAIMAAANYPFGTSVEYGYATNVYNPGNKDLTWETTWQHDAGIELDILKRISLEVDYYYKKTTDLLQYKQVPPSTGILQILSNSGSVITRGLEASLNVRAIQNKDFSLSFGGNISFNKNEICDFGKDPMFPNSIYNSLRPYAIADGHSIGSFYGFVTDGIWNSREEVINSKQFKTQYPEPTENGTDAATEEIIRRDLIG